MLSRAQRSILSMLALLLCATLLWLGPSPCLAETKAPGVSVLAYMQNEGWAPSWSTDGATAGTPGKSLSMEALRLRLDNLGDTKGTIQYRSHVQKQGWQDWVTGDAVSGTQGEGLRVEAVQIRLSGSLSEKYDVWYRVHARRYGWMGWAKGGETAGTAGMGIRLEAIQVVLRQKDGEKPPATDQNTPEAFVGKEEVRVSVHLQDKGWQDSVGNGMATGAADKTEQVDSMRATLAGIRVPGYVETSICVSQEGWTDWVGNGEVAGSPDKGQRVEAIKMHLRDEAAGTYDLYYRVSLRGAGWLSWAKEDEVAGSSGMSLGIAQIEAILLPQGSKPPSNADAKVSTSSVVSLSVVYSSYVNGAWQDGVADGAESGTTGKGIPIEAIKAHLVCDKGKEEGDISYRVFIHGQGWVDWVRNDGVAGMTNAGNYVEAIQVRLTGVAASVYDVWYCCHVQSHGWLGWTKNGASAGSSSLKKRVEAIQIRLVPKDDRDASGSAAQSFIDGTLRTGLNAASGAQEVTTFGSYTAGSGAMEGLNNAVAKLQDSGYAVGFIMMDLRTCRGVAYNCDALFYGASSIKAPYIMSVVYEHPDAATTFAYDMTETLYYSWDSNYKQVLAAYGEEPMRKWCTESGVRPSIADQLPWADYSARDLAKLWARSYQLYQASSACEQVGEWCENPNESTIHATLGDKYRTRSKGGWIDDGEGGMVRPDINGGHEYWRATIDGGIVYAKNGAYVVAIMSSVPANHDALNELTAAIDYAHGEM